MMVLNVKYRGYLLVYLMAVLLIFSSNVLSESRKILYENLTSQYWKSYRDNFIDNTGRIIDNYHHISHSEGQGTGMLFSVFINDHEAFKTIWAWTRKNLQRKDNLFSWRWELNAKPHITDINNATDGDILIAWSLLRAYWRWGVDEYKKSSLEILDGISKKLVVDFAGYQLLLPAEKHYFTSSNSFIINPSYFILPAFVDIAEFTKDTLWVEVYLNSLLIVTNTLNHKGINFITDWVEVNGLGQIYYSSQHEPTFGYDAIRVPLYLAWCKNNKHLELFNKFWMSFDHWNRAPSWINVKTLKHADYLPEDGMIAIRALSIGLEEKKLLNMYLERHLPFKDYYSASLSFFTLMAAYERHHKSCF